jgi:hypothetical protein
MLNYLQQQIDQLRWQGRTREREHQVAIATRTRIQDMRYLLLKAQRIAATKTYCGLQESRLKMRLSSNSCRRAFFLPSPPYLDATSERALIRYHDRALNALPKTHEDGAALER